MGVMGAVTDIAGTVTRVESASMDLNATETVVGNASSATDRPAVRDATTGISGRRVAQTAVGVA